MRNTGKKLLTMALAVVLAVSMLTPAEISAAAKPKISVAKATLYTGYTKKLTVKNNKNKVTWSSSNKKVAKVDSKGVVTAVDKGTANIKAYIKATKKTYTCKMTVKRKSLSLYNSKAEKAQVATGCQTFLNYELRQFLENKGDKIRSDATWISSDEKIFAPLSTGNGMRAYEFGKIKLTVKSGSKTFIYDVDIVSKDPKALTDKDFDFVNGDFNGYTNYIEKVNREKMPFIPNDNQEWYKVFRDENFAKKWEEEVPFSITFKENKDVEMARGIKLGSTLKEVYEAYGNVYTTKWNKTTSSLDDAKHKLTKSVGLHYGIKDENICYQVAISLDQNDKVMAIVYRVHLYHGN